MRVEISRRKNCDASQRDGCANNFRTLVTLMGALFAADLETSCIGFMTLAMRIEQSHTAYQFNSAHHDEIYQSEFLAAVTA